MGHSMGGLIALKYMIDNPENHFCAVILNGKAFICDMILAVAQVVV